MHPEEKARLDIDKQLTACGYVIQDFNELDLSVAKGVIIREYPTSTGPVDYLIFISGKPYGIIEAKKEDKGIDLVLETEKQTYRYSTSEYRFLDNVRIKFIYESTGVITRFTDLDDIDYRSREVFTFHTPDELEYMIKRKDTLRNMLKIFPKFDDRGFRKCQTNAILNLENSFSLNKPKALIQMATGAGKTYTAITSVYRLLKYADAKRILFLVDTKNLGKQAMDEFFAYKPTDSTKTFTEIYNVQLLKSSFIASTSNVVICTIQRLYSILRGEELSEEDEETIDENKYNAQIKEVSFNSKYPIGFFDFVFIDECHRSIYNLWKQVLDYFDFFQTGLTATPDKRTFAYFNENVVSEYSREQAIIDGVNVGEDEYLIKTEISTNGAKISKSHRIIQKRERLTRKKRWDSIDEDIVYEANELDKEIVNYSQIRSIIKEFKRAIEEVVYPERKELPKTLIFAKSDSHADDIIQIVREEFGKGNEFCRKITYKINGKPDDEINSFRNDYNFRVAVTVDMIATGIDIKPLECLVFMRDVKSKNYYEQMKGRGTRTINYEEFIKVSPSATYTKDHFVIFDAVGVTQSKKSDGRTLERKPYESLKNLMVQIALGSQDEDVLTTVAGRLTRIDKIALPDEIKKVVDLSGGKDIKTIVSDLLNSFDDDYVEEFGKERLNKTELTQEDIKQIQEELIKESVKPFSNAKLREHILKIKETHEQVIDNVNIDTVVYSDWSDTYINDVDSTIKSFRDFIETNKNEIEALSIIYSQKDKNKKLTYRMIEELYEIMRNPPYNFTVQKMWQCYYVKDNQRVKKTEINKLIDIISIIKYELGQINELDSFSSRVKIRFKEWIFKRNSSQGFRFTDEQVSWLQLIRDHISTSLVIEPDDLDYAPFDNMGGLGKFYALFGVGYLNILNEINVALAT